MQIQRHVNGSPKSPSPIALRRGIAGNGRTVDRANAMPYIRSGRRPDSGCTAIQNQRPKYGPRARTHGTSFGT